MQVTDSPVIAGLDYATMAAWLRLDQTPGLGRVSARRLLETYGSPQAVFAAAQALARNGSPALAAGGQYDDASASASASASAEAEAEAEAGAGAGAGADADADAAAGAPTAAAAVVAATPCVTATELDLSALSANGGDAELPDAAAATPDAADAQAFAPSRESREPAAGPARLTAALAKALAAPVSAVLQQLCEATWAWMQEPGNRLLSLHDPAYPPLLLHIPDPPLLLYAKGRVELLQAPALAMVGSRNASLQGEANAQRFAQAISAAGLTIVSGLALGIDAAAHRGGLQGAGATIAVIATGVDRIYPRRNAVLARQIAEQGCLISEFALGTPPRDHHFPRRNRIISGLARGVLVVEAAERSGSLITAHQAAAQGREVFAIPGSIHSPLSKGCHILIREGAKLVDTVEHVLEELGWEASLPDWPIVSASRHTATAARAGTGAGAAGMAGMADGAGSGTSAGKADEAAAPGALDASRRWPACAERLLAALGHDPLPAGALAARLQLATGMVQAHLLALELAGAVERLPGGAFRRLAG